MRRLWLVLLLTSVAAAQNVVTEADGDRTAPAITLSEAQVAGWLGRAPVLPRLPAAPDAADRALQAKLARHIDDLIAGWPLKPWVVQLGISGTETFYDHPDELFYALCCAYSVLPAESQAKLRAFLADQLRLAPPDSVRGYARRLGTARELYDAEPIRRDGTGAARDVFGVYALECYTTIEPAAGQRLRSVIADTLEKRGQVRFPLGTDAAEDAEGLAERLNGDIAGLWTAARVDGGPWLARLTALLELRVNLERRNAHVLTRTADSSRGLHAAKLPRYLRLTPELGRILREQTDGLAAERIKAFRLARPVWYLAWTERLIGGENYISPPHLGDALFRGALFCEQVPRAQCRAWVDEPWCRGDLYWIVKASWALDAGTAGK